MKYYLIILFSLLSINISLAQSGWGYVNYTSYKTHNGNGSTSQYGQFANNAAGFDVMFNTLNSNTTIFRTGEVTLQAMASGSSTVPRWNNDYFGYKFEFWFVPQETGLYYFGINSDDASDLFIDGIAVTTYYGGHGASAYQIGGMNMIAGRRYRVVARMQEYGGGEAFYFQWLKPSQIGGWGYWNNEVTNLESEPTKKAIINFDFGTTLDKTKFLVGSRSLNSNGVVDVTNLLDSNKVDNGYKGTLVGGEVEWAYVSNYNNGTMLLNVDLRTFGSIQPSTINSMKILDVYDGPVSYVNSNTYWAVYTIPTQTYTPGTYIRDMGAGSYAFKCNVTYSNNMVYKPQSVTMTTTNNVTTLFNTILTVSDVYLAFKELSNSGIFGNQTGNEFTYGIQYKNADVNDDNIFNETDCFLLLQHLTGKKNLVDTFNLRKTLKLIPQSTYNNIGKSNWSTFPSYLNDAYQFNINTGKSIDTFNVSATWKGDINLSHSSIPAPNGITTNSTNFSMNIRSMSSTNSIGSVESDIMMEKIGDSVITTIKVNPNGNQIGAIQFEVYFDESILEYSSVEFTNTTSTNFGRKNVSSVSVGTLNTSGGSVSNIGYKVTFKPKTNITNILGLISIKNIEALSTSSDKLNVMIL